MASGSVKVNWYGAQAAAAARAALTDGLVATAEQAVATAQANAPVATGRLRQSLAVLTVDDGPDGATVNWGTQGVDYAAEQELFNAERPRFLRQAAERQYADLADAVAAALRRRAER